MIPLSANSVSNAAIGQCQRSDLTIDSNSSYEPSFHVVLHQPEIPPNTGAIGRTCLALHAKLWLVRPLGFEITEKSLRRAGLDYWQHLNWEAVDDWSHLESRSKETNRAAEKTLPNARVITGNAKQRMWMFTKKASRDFRDADLAPGDWLVFGCETRGLPDQLLGQPEQNLRIPTFDQVRSLNLSSAVAVAGYQAASQINLFASKK